MISAQSFLDTITRQVCRLVGCGATLLVIDCPVPELRHPLLTLIPSTTPIAARSFGAGHLASLLGLEQMRAACDLACQRGKVQYLSPSLGGAGEMASYNAVAPLSSPAGILGYLLLTSSLDFTRGEDSLLCSYLQYILPGVEKAVRAQLLSCFIKEARCIHGHSTSETEQRQLPVALNSISIVSHELRTPLAAIKGYAGLLQAYSAADAKLEVLSETALTPAHQQHYLDMIIEETRHLEELIADLLDASRVQSGKLSLRLAAVDVGEACLRAVRRARQYIEQQRQAQPRLECVVAPGLPLISVDVDRIQHILNNLLDNAVKYSPRGGNIELKADSITLPSEDGQNAERQVVRIVVRDQGIGIPPEQYTRLFQPFSRIDHPQVSQTQGVQGVGLGLYITRQLVEAMHGSIDISSQVDEGTRVTLCFPSERIQLDDNSSLSVLQSRIAYGPQRVSSCRQ